MADETTLQPKLYETLDEAKEALQAFQTEFVALAQKYGLSLVWLNFEVLRVGPEGPDGLARMAFDGERGALISMAEDAILTMLRHIREWEAAAHPCPTVEAMEDLLAARRLGQKAAKRGPWDAG